MRKRRLRVAAFMAILASALALAAPLRAADTPPRDPSTIKSIAGAGGASSTVSPALRPARPYWIELSIAQRQALAPLTDDWERLDGQTKKKWVEIANRYPKMKPDEQTHTQERMREWALLTPEQRRVARDSFARVRAMPPEQRAEMLRKYRELPDEKKHQLAIQNQATKVLVVPKPQATPPSRRVQISEGAKVKNPALAVQKATGSGTPAADASKPAEAVKPPASTAPSAVPVVAQPAAPPVPPASPPADAPAK